jgi:hypothetical protein
MTCKPLCHSQKVSMFYILQVIKQRHVILSFLAMECKITNEHTDIIWQAAQLKHCSKQVHDLLPPLIKNLEAGPVLHLYGLLCKLEPKDHTEQASWSVNSFRLLIVLNPPESNDNPNTTYSEHNCCLVWYRDKICHMFCVQNAGLMCITLRWNREVWFLSIVLLNGRSSLFACAILYILTCHLVFFPYCWLCAIESYVYRQKNGGPFMMLHLWNHHYSEL